MTLLRRERDSNRRSLSSGSARARLAAGGNGIRTVSPSPVRVGLFAACGKFAAWLDLFMTPWWRDSNSWSRRLQEPFETLIGSRGIAPSDGEADSVAGGTGGLKPRSSVGGSILTGAFNEKSPRLGLGKRFVKMPRAVLIPGIISRSERRPG